MFDGAEVQTLFDGLGGVIIPHPHTLVARGAGTGLSYYKCAPDYCYMVSPLPTRSEVCSHLPARPHAPKAYIRSSPTPPSSDESRQPAKHTAASSVIQTSSRLKSKYWRELKACCQGGLADNPVRRWTIWRRDAGTRRQIVAENLTLPLDIATVSIEDVRSVARS